MDDYELGIEKAVSEIRKQKAKRVCLQLPDGLKPKAGEIAEILKEKTGADMVIWLGTCFGACDIPELGSLKPDMIIQWGHSRWSS